MRPPASPSCRLYEPEAAGTKGAWAPEGNRKSEIGMRKWEKGESYILSLYFKKYGEEVKH